MNSIQAKVRSPIPLIDPSRKVVLYTNAKCGGTTLKRWFLKNVGMSRYGSVPWMMVPKFGFRFSWLFVRYGRQLLNSIDGGSEAGDEELLRFVSFYREQFCHPHILAGRAASYYRICVVRNPFDRVVSAFIDKFCGEHPYSRAAEVINSSGTAGRITFNQFLGYLEQTNDEAHDSHWRRQTYVLDGVSIDSFVRLERIREDFEKVRTIVGSDHFQVFDKKRQSNQYQAEPVVSHLSVPEMTNAELFQFFQCNGTYPHKMLFLNDETRRRIRLIYREDFEKLPYS